MKLALVVLIPLVLTGCVKEVPLTEKQKILIEQHVSMYGPQVVVEGAIEVEQEPALPGESKYAACGACHGAQGGGGVGPQLSGQTSEYIVNRLTQYKNGEKVGSQSNLMWGQAAGLSDQDMKDLAEYIVTL